MSASTLGTILQACSSDDGEGSRGSDSPEPGAPAANDGDAVDGGAGSNRIVVGVRQGDANSGLDPVNMTEIGTYAVVAQSFEYLVGRAGDGAVEPTALATAWSPNDDGSVWTFTLREGPTWADGSPLRAADVAATIDRLVAVHNAGVAGVLAEGSVEAPNDSTVVFRLSEPFGNFPSLLSPDNPPAVITPADYRSGTTLDSRADGTGPWRLESFDAPTFVAVFRRNPAWWGGRVQVDTVELRGFGDESEAIAALEADEIDAIQRVATTAGRALLEQPGFTMIRERSSAHHQLWFNTRRGTFSDPRLRLAIAWALDRNRGIDDADVGCGLVANDHPIHSDLGSMPFYDPSAVVQRRSDPDRSRALLAAAGGAELRVVLNASERSRAVALAESVRTDAAAVGIEVDVVTEPTDTFYRETWCSTVESGPPCRDSADFGIIDYEHHALPDVVLGRALATGGDWNASNYENSAFDRLLRDYRRSIDLDGQRAAIGGIQRLVWGDVPIVIPCFEDVVAGHTTSVSGMRTYPSGQVVLTGARRR